MVRLSDRQLAGQEQLTGEQKDAIVKEAADARAAGCANAREVQAAKKSAALGVKPKAASKPAAATSAAKAAGAGAKKPSATARVPPAVAGRLAPAKPGKVPVKGKKSKVPAAAGPSAAEAAAAAEARMLAEEQEREAERERRWAERTEERAAVQAEIVAEERRLRAREAERRAVAAALSRQQARLREDAFEGDLAAVRKTVDGWVEDCFGASLIGAKLDCPDANGYTPLSEAACGGHVSVVNLLLDHGANVNATNAQGRTPLWRAAFQDQREVAFALLSRGANPSLAAEGAETPLMVAPTDGMRALLREWVGDPPRLRAAADRRAAETEKQWIPPPPADAPVGEAGYSLKIGIARLADALDAIWRDSDRPALVVDLGERAAMYLKYRDVNMALAYRPADCELSTLRMLVLGALRYGKPLVLDFLALDLTEESLRQMLDPVMPGLVQLLISKQITREENYMRLLSPSDPEEYAATLWREETTRHFQLIVLTKLPRPAEWLVQNFFVLKVA